MSSDFELDPLEVAASGQKIIEIAGEALTNRQLVRYNANGQLVTADASAAATLPCIGMTLAVAAHGQRVEVLLRGYVGLATWTWTAGGRLYVTDVAGVLGAATGTVTQEVGVARSGTQIWFHPQGLDTVGGALAPHVLATTGPHTNTLPLTDLAVGAQGEVIHRGAVDWEVLAVGVAADVLTSGGPGADVQWVAPGAPGAHEATHVRGGVDDIDAALDARAIALANQGEIVFHAAGANTLVALPVGVAGQVLTSGGPAADVSWGAASVGDTRTSTIVVAASNSLDPTLAEAAYRCDGVADDVQINAAIAALPAGGGRVMLLEGTFNIIADIAMVDGLTLSGQGYGTLIFQVNGSNLARMIGNNVGRNNVTIENLYLDGNRANNGAAQYGIQFALATHSVVKNCWVVDCEDSGIKVSKDGVQVVNNFVSGCGFFGIEASQTTAVYYTIIANNVVTGNGTGGIYADGGVVMGNLAYNNGASAAHAGIYIAHASPLTQVIGNTCVGNYNQGIMVGGHDTIEGPVIISGNSCFENEGHGIYMDEAATQGLVITGNICKNNSQDGAGNFSGIFIGSGASYNIITGNSCSDDQGAKTQRYGIDIDTTCVGNVVKNNMLRGNLTGHIRDLGTDTIFASKVFQFQHGGTAEGTVADTEFVSATASAKGWKVDGGTGWAVALGHLPLEVQSIIRMKIWAVALGSPIGGGGQMHLEIVANAGADNLAFNTSTSALANVDSETTDYVANDVVHWVVGGVGSGGQSLEVKVIYEAGSDPDGATNAVFRAVEVEYV